MPATTTSRVVGPSTAAATPTAAPGAPGAPIFQFPDRNPSVSANPLGGSGAIYNLPTGTAPFGYPAMPSGAGGGGGGEEERGDRAKLARSFTIRQPPSVYIEDDQDLDQTGHPRYKSASDALNHPYYGDHHRTPGLVEYELSDTSGQKYGPSSVAERKRYVEQQQRKVMDEYEMFNPHMDAPPTSPYPPSQLTSAPSYTSAATPGPLSPTMTPSMGGRSPRVHHHHPSQSPSPFGRPRQQHDSNDYQY
ncbi:hypothetical protein BGZ70_001466 [Mortierella alpina]|uniref:Uncharacterized protein n=1 Tax=Mortierella alpina TaxID=64518 RepID=A0A9P6M5R1_MORAP|nr:hypothetical protein BGZ70_001466 [Mortierella alpina]